MFHISIIIYDHNFSINQKKWISSVFHKSLEIEYCLRRKEAPANSESGDCLQPPGRWPLGKMAASRSRTDIQDRYSQLGTEWRESPGCSPLQSWVWLPFSESWHFLQGCLWSLFYTECFCPGTRWSLRKVNPQETARSPVTGSNDSGANVIVLVTPIMSNTLWPLSQQITLNQCPNKDMHSTLQKVIKAKLPCPSSVEWT